MLDTAGNELAFLDKHKTALSSLHVVEPVALVRDFTPGLSAVVLPKLTSFSTTSLDIVKVVLPQLVQVVSAWRGRGFVHGDLKPKNLVVSRVAPPARRAVAVRGQAPCLTRPAKGVGKGSSELPPTGSRPGRGGGGASETRIRVNRKHRERYAVRTPESKVGPTTVARFSFRTVGKGRSRRRAGTGSSCRLC